MSRLNLEDNKLYAPTIETLFKLRTIELVPADNHVFDADYPPLVIMNPAGAVDVLMPASSDTLKGVCYLISNVSANAITLKTSADAAFTTAIVLAGGESAWVFCTGSATAALGWRAIATAAST